MLLIPILTEMQLPSLHCSSQSIHIGMTTAMVWYVGVKA